MAELSGRQASCLLDALAKESQDHKALTLPPPKRPAQTLTTLVSSKRPKQNPQPTGRGRVKFKVKGRFPGHSAHRGKGCGANKGRNVPDVRIPACMKAPEVPPLTVRTSVQSPEKIAGRLSKFSGGGGGGGLVRDRCRPLGYAHRTMGVQDPPCDAAATETSGTRDHIPQGVLRVVVSEPVSARAAEQGSDRANFTLPGCYSRLFLVRKATGEWRPIIRSVLFVHCPSFTMETPQQGQWLTSLDLKDAYFHIGSTQQTDAVLSQRHLLAVHSTVIRVVNQSKSISKILKPVLAIAHLHRVKIALVHRRLVVKPRDTPGSSRANILAQVSVPKAWVGFKT